jgi:hypothetical protein
VPLGSEVAFQVNATGTTPFAYQWQFNGAPIPGATNHVYFVANAQAGNAGEYRVVISNAAGSTTSSNASLSFMHLPVITVQPQPLATNIGSSLRLGVTASSEGPLNYQWRRNGILIPGMTNGLLILPNVQLADSGGYSVLVGNAAGVVASAVAPVEVYQGVEILVHPQSRTNNPGATVTFSVVATNGGSGALQYQWWLNGTNLAGQTSASLILSNVQLEDSGNYQVLVSDSRGAVLSQPATLIVLVRPSITLHPDGAIVAVGDRVTITAGASGTMPIDYRWRRISAYIVTNRVYTPTDTLVIENVQTNDSGFYTVAFANQAGTASSLTSNAFLTVVIPPTNQLAEPGANVQISAEAYGRTYIQYQWQFKGVNLTGATNALLSLTNVQAADSGPYTVVVSVNTNRVIAPAAFTAQLQVGAPRISLSQPAMQPNGAFQFLINGAPGQVLWIDVSTNIMPWSVQQSFRYTNGAGPFVDPPGATPVPRRFYRARTAE